MSKKSKQETLFLNLPSEILTNILSRLPVRSIIRCKYVCKQFRQILSTHEFAKSHLSLSNTPGLVIYQHKEEILLKLLEYEDTLKLQTHNLRDLKLMKFEASTFMDSAPCYASVIRCWGSVDGFLCLEYYSVTHPCSVFICNPITREYIHILMPKHAVGSLLFTRSGFGLSRLSGQYKVVVIYSIRNLEPLDNECLVYTLGTTGSWRSVAPDASRVVNAKSTGQFLNGNLHWLVIDIDSGPFISCFDLEIEQFKSFSLPQTWDFLPDSVTFVILEDCLCLCDNEPDNDDMVLWVMTEYGIEKSWTRKFKISKSLLEDWPCAHEELIFPVKAFADGGILFSWENKVLFYYCDKTKSTRSVKVFEKDSSVYRYRGHIGTLIHTFSFISLKHFGVENVISF